MMRDNRETALKMLESPSTGVFNEEIATPDITWWIAGRGLRTKEEFREGAAGFRANIVRREPLKIHGITAEGNRLAVEAETYMEMKNGKIYNNSYHFLFLFRDGRIYHAKEYHDTLHASQTFERWGKGEG